MEIRSALTIRVLELSWYVHNATEEDLVTFLHPPTEIKRKKKEPIAQK